MDSLISALEQRFGENRVKEFTDYGEGYISLLQIDIQTQHSLRVLMTNGISDYQMPIPEHLTSVKDRVFTEIFFCIPSYWELSDKDNPNRNWPIKVLQKLAKNLLGNKTWYGPGHTIANGNPTQPISDLMQQEYFLLTDPIHLENHLAPLTIGDKTIHFLAVIPLFNKEYDQLVYKAYPKWIRKYRNRNGNEILDDFKTESSSKFSFFRR